MFTIRSLKQENSNFMILQNVDKSTVAKINLEEGGRLQNLKINNTILIEEIDTFCYKSSYASSILFPFASRIEHGKYVYDNKEFILECNDSGENALHGLVFDKTFSILEKSESENHASVILNYQETKENKGFPYTYNIQLTYTLYKNELSLSVKVENTSDKTFPFTLGWHPYFLSDSLKKSFLKFKSNQKIEFNKNLITKKIIDYKPEETFKIEDQQLDDCFILNSESVDFFTPHYHIEISSNQIENYLQLYTPKDLPLIAIEPMTGISNSFNNKIGLQTLDPDQTYSVKWSVKLNN